MLFNSNLSRHCVAVRGMTQSGCVTSKGFCRQNTFTARFSAHMHICTHHIVAQGVARRVCIRDVHPHVIPRLSVWCFLVFFLCLSCFSLSLLPVFCPELQLPCCRERRALNQMRTRKMRSIAPWRYTTLSQIPCQEPQKPTKHPGAETPRPSIEIPAQENLFQKYKE